MRQYEVTFIVDPVLSGDEIKATAQTYVDMIKQDSTIVHMDEMGLRQLAYPINKRTSGIYYCIEFQVEGQNVVDQIELAFRRDERVMRFLSLKLDKYGVKYNEDKRNGLIGKVKKKKKKEEEDTRHNKNRKGKRKPNSGPAKKAAPAPAAKAPAAKAPAKKAAPAPKATAAKKEEE